MAKFDANSTLKRLQNRYRLVVMNDDTYEEVVTFKLSRLSVYIFLSRELKMRTDSLEQEMRYRDQYFQGLKNVLGGNSTVKMDTTALKIPKPEKIND